MNSRLNQEIRDRRGLAYTVDSNVSLLSDCGTLNIYFGSDPETADRCAAIVRREIDRLAQGPLSARTFARVRDQYCGQLLVSSDNRESAAMSLAKSVMYFDEIHDVNRAIERVRAVTADDLTDVAQMIASQTLNRLTLK